MMMNAWIKLTISWLKTISRKNVVRWLCLGITVGAVSGLAAVAFFYLLGLAKHFTYYFLAGYVAPTPEGEKIFESVSGLQFRRWVFFLLPVAGGLLSGLLVYLIAPEAEGHGTDAMIDAFHNKRGKIRQRVPFIKAAATIVTLATGGSAGREGPIAQIGSGLGSMIATLFKLSDRERRNLLLAGCAGGLAAIFRAPLGSAITSIEVLYREDFETEALIPTIISSITAYIIFAELFGFHTIFYFPGYSFSDPRELIFYLLLGLICIPAGMLFIKIFYGIRDYMFMPLRIPRFFKPALGGLGVGVIGLFFPQVYGDGWGWIQLAILGKLSIGLMITIALMKIFATSFTISSGGSGGVFGPTLFIGGMIGGAVGFLSNHFYPGIVQHPEAFVVVGMAAFFAGVANAPIGSLLMCSEMTQGYGLIAPLMLVSMMAVIFTRKYSIYEKQVKNRLHSPAHIGDFTINVLEDMKIGKYYIQKKIPAIARATPYGELKKIFAASVNDCYPVSDEGGEIIGCINWHHARPIVFEHGLEHILIAQDLMTRPAATLTSEDSLYDALLKILNTDQREVLIVNSSNPGEVIGVLRQDDVIQAYSREILRRKGENPPSSK
jgi:CIC family chloride channel protein